MLLPIHIVAAAVGLIAGTVALSVAKGSRLHRKSGMVFAYAMIAMCASALVAAVARGQAVNVIAASMTAYLVLTGLMTVRLKLLAAWRPAPSVAVTAKLDVPAAVGVPASAPPAPSASPFGRAPDASAQV